MWNESQGKPLDQSAAVWVTGSSSGIGLAIAQRLLADGWQVVGLDVAPAAIQKNPAFESHTLDLTDAQACAALAATMLETGVPGALVHAAGFMQTAALGHLNAEAGQGMWAVHVQAATVLANAVLPAMQNKGHGRVVLLGSRVSTGKAGRSQYAACKAALVALARSWAAETVRQGVTVNVISPAATDTPLLQGGGRSSSAPQKPPIGRYIQPAEVAALAAFLLSSQAAAITGQDIAICGGASLPF